MDQLLMTRTLLIEYDDVLIGRKEKIKSDFFYGEAHPELNLANIKMLFKYAIEEILGWTPKTAKLRFDDYIIDLLKLRPILRYIEFPAEIQEGDPTYILSLLYPNEVKIKRQNLVAEVTERMRQGIDKQYPRNYFLGAVGFQRFCYCLKYIIEFDLVSSSIPEIYEFFFSSKGRHLLYEYKLRNAIYQYGLDIRKAIYEVTKELPLARFWYGYYSFSQEYRTFGQNKKAEQFLESLREEAAKNYKEEEQQDSFIPKEFLLPPQEKEKFHLNEFSHFLDVKKITDNEEEMTDYQLEEFTEELEEETKKMLGLK